jgi:hypothetical protein
MDESIYIKAPISPNIKCIIFATVIMMGYYLSAGKTANLLLLPVIFIVSYISMAWYDKRYNCSETLKSGSSVAMVDSIFKPSLGQQLNSGVLSPDEQKLAYQKNVYLFHMLLVAPILIYVGMNTVKTNKNVFALLLALGYGALIYHTYRFFTIKKLVSV